MTYTTAEARKQLLDSLAVATDELGVALSALTDVYDELEEHAADQLEESLFRPVQGAYGRAQRVHSDFASRYSLPTHRFAPQSPGTRPHDIKGGIEHAVESVASAEFELASLQDSMLPVEVGDPEVRAGLAEVRTMIAEVPRSARELLRRFGR
jgi:hypothetical protein